MCLDAGSKCDRFWCILCKLHGNYVYISSPTSVIPRVLSKIDEEGATTIVKVPQWPTQTWFSKLKEMLTALPLLFPRNRRLLTLEGQGDKVHPLYPRLCLAAYHLSAVGYNNLTSLNAPKISLWALGDQGPLSSTMVTWKHWRSLPWSASLTRFTPALWTSYNFYPCCWWKHRL